MKSAYSFVDDGKLIHIRGLLLIVLTLGLEDQTSDLVVAWEVWVGEEYVQLKLANQVTLLVEEFDDCVEARALIDLDGSGHLFDGGIGNVVCTSASLRVVPKLCAV
jgi:hypothetical protein